jgi:phage terminase large subunit
VPWTEQDDILLATLIRQQKLESVSPVMDAFRHPCRIKLVRGGRGAAAKSWSIASLLIQKSNARPLRIGCFREVQRSLEESSFALLEQTIKRLGYNGWRVTNEFLKSPTGSHIIFRGLKDIRAAGQVKGLESFDIFWLEEAATISQESLNMILPTLRKPGSELWASWNRETETDPIDVTLWNSKRDDIIRVDARPGKLDNPWFTAELQKEMEEAYRIDPDLAEHIWGGLPLKQGQRSVMSRVAIRAAMDRDIKGEGVIQVGCDVARFGDDNTEIYKRKGLKTIGHKSFAKQDTMKTAYECWDMANRDPSVPICIDDTGVGGGVTDRLRELGAKVIPVNFGASPNDKDKYTSIADELWFGFPIDEVDIPDDGALMAELSGRRYDYDNKGRRKIESKDVYKKRCGKSPDKADAILLTYFQGAGITFPDEIRAQMRNRRKAVNYD